MFSRNTAPRARLYYSTAQVKKRQFVPITGENIWPCGQTERWCVIPGVDSVEEMNSACPCPVPFSFAVHRRLNNVVSGWGLGTGSN